jgi:hypothetical protein
MDEEDYLGMSLLGMRKGLKLIFRPMDNTRTYTIINKIMPLRRACDNEFNLLL